VLPSPTTFFSREKAMEATVKQVETTKIDAEQLKSKEASEAMRELASFELSLVGGGQGIVIFA
jgi:precorrin-6B methylase 2